MEEDNFPRPQQLLRNYNTAESVANTPSGVADDMGVTFLKAEGSEDVCEVESANSQFLNLNQVYCWCGSFFSAREKGMWIHRIHTDTSVHARYYNDFAIQ